MVLALLVCLSLIFTSAQVYRINTAAARVQDIADAAALAAENEVAEYVLVARVCDALVLSMTLTALVSFALGLVALCVPATGGMSVKLIDVGKAVIKARDGFSDRATQGLEALQKALPFLAAANAAAVAVENGAGENRSSYIAMAVLVPGTGEPLTVEAAKGAEDVEEAVDEGKDEIRDQSIEAEGLAEEANLAKEAAFERDCGDNPSYCLYERAKALAGLSGDSNPLYRSVDAWSFKVPLERAKAYYQRRLAIESPADGSAREGARSALRKRLYRYAVSLLKQGYVVDTEEEFRCNFPRLPRNADQVRGTELYGESVYPITRTEAGNTLMHAWSGCPSATGIIGHESIRDLERNNYLTCPDCEFTASSMGSVAAASSSIENGFEYHYRAIAEEAELYEEAREELDSQKNSVQRKVQKILDEIEDALKSAAGKRISVKPPGSMGAVALAADLSSSTPSSGLGSSFVQGRHELGPRAAVAGATLLADDQNEGSTVISSLLDGFDAQDNVAVGALQCVLGCWSAVLTAYTKGQQALVEGLSNGLSQIPLASQSGLGDWAAEKVMDTIQKAGLQPAKVESLKPVLVSTGSVVAKDQGQFAVAYRQVKERSKLLSGSSADVFSTVLSKVEQQAVAALGAEYTIATVEPLGELGPSLPLTLTLPEPLQNAGKGLVDSLIARLRILVVNATGVSSWG
ncbi:MAG: molybdenum cofactor biosynthesis enzyme [Coriobacteriia bacterium]|nr:molybdenum cofactor biosynthesis enzyme [Coriobacteriia bacterium]